MILKNQIVVKDNLLNSHLFVIENNDILTIDKTMGTLSNGYFDCICIRDDTDDKVDLIIDQLVCNPYTKEISLLNTRNIESSVMARIVLKEDQLASLYAFGTDSILIVINNEGEIK